jgi:hypothetical protein
MLPRSTSRATSYSSSLVSWPRIGAGCAPRGVRGHSIRSGRPCWCCGGSVNGAALPDPRRGVSQATGYRYLHEGITVPADQAPDLHKVPERCQKSGMPHVILNGTLIKCDRVAGARENGNHWWFSHKHKAFGGNVQILSAPDSTPLWVCDVEPGSAPGHHPPPQSTRCPPSTRPPPKACRLWPTRITSVPAPASTSPSAAPAAAQSKPSTPTPRCETQAVGWPVLVVVTTMDLPAQMAAAWRAGGRTGPSYGICSLRAEDAPGVRVRTWANWWSRQAPWRPSRCSPRTPRWGWVRSSESVGCHPRQRQGPGGPQALHDRHPTAARQGSPIGHRTRVPTCCSADHRGEDRQRAGPPIGSTRPRSSCLSWSGGRPSAGRAGRPGTGRDHLRRRHVLDAGAGRWRWRRRPHR